MRPYRRRRPDPATLAEGVLSGDRLALARALSLAENERPGAHSLLHMLFPHTGHAHIIGVTGAPGAGKSTLVTRLVQAQRAAGRSVGVAAIDPTSPFTGGALLGDRVRMRALSGDEGVFIRSMATRGSLGGLAKTANDIVAILDAAGFERIIVETVGVGQAEVEIASLAHTTLVVEAPGLGDEVQAIKAGILEIADLLVVNKADRPGADRTIRALEAMLAHDADTSRQLRHHGLLADKAMDRPADLSSDEARWRVMIYATSAASGDGIDALSAAVEAHRTWLHESGELIVRERLRMAHALDAILQAELNRRVAAVLPHTGVAEMVEAIRLREMDPYEAALALLED